MSSAGQKSKGSDTMKEANVHYGAISTGKYSPTELGGCALLPEPASYGPNVVSDSKRGKPWTILLGQGN